LPTRDLGFTVASSRLALGRGEVLPRATGDELGEQPVQPVHGLHPPSRQLVAPVCQQPQRDQLLIEREHPQVRGAQCCGRDRVGVGGVGLPGVAGVEDPDPCRELGRDVDHRLTVGEQPLRQRPAHRWCGHCRRT